MFYKILNGRTIQLSDVDIQGEGYRLVVESEKPAEKEGFFICPEYRIVDGEVHCVYTYREIIREEDL